MNNESNQTATATNKRPEIDAELERLKNRVRLEHSKKYAEKFQTGRIATAELSEGELEAERELQAYIRASAVNLSPKPADMADEEKALADKLKASMEAERTRRVENSKKFVASKTAVAPTTAPTTAESNETIETIEVIEDRLLGVIDPDETARLKNKLARLKREQKAGKQKTVSDTDKTNKPAIRNGENESAPCYDSANKRFVFDATNDFLQEWGIHSDGGGNRYRSACPAHGGHNEQTLSIKDTGDGFCILHCHAGCSTAELVQALGATESQSDSDSGNGATEPAPTNRTASPLIARDWQDLDLIAEYKYHDRAGGFLFGKEKYLCRISGAKTFRAYRYEGGAKKYDVPKELLTIYNLPEVIKTASAGGIVAICEGEKDAETIKRVFPKLTATTAPLGAGSWKDEYADLLAGARGVYLFGDNDEKGKEYVLTVATSLKKRGINFKHVKRMPFGKDVSDWIANLEKDGKNPTAELKALLNDKTLVEADTISFTDSDPQTAVIKPWQTVTNTDVRKAIAGTPLETIVSVLESATDTPLPIELTLPKALALAGCALSQPMQKDINEKNNEHDGQYTTESGSDLLRLRIQTAGGQACNIFALQIAGSGQCKDIGGLDTKIAMKKGWFVGDSGSSEGLADAFISNPCGLVRIAEFMPFLDKKSWQYSATAWLTKAFNQGHFHQVFSKRGASKTNERKAVVCYPSIVANVQPKVISQYLDSIQLDQGFIPRFLITTRTDTEFYRPTNQPIDLQPALDALSIYEGWGGNVELPERYLQDVADEFLTHGAKLGAFTARLINEYGARFAVMLSKDPQRITADELNRAGVLVKWFYNHAERAFETINDSPYERQREDRLDRLKAFIRRHSPTSLSYIAKGFRSDSKQRREDIAELVERGVIITKEEAGHGRKKETIICMA